MRYLLALILAFGIGLFAAPNTEALGLKIAPHSYEATLAKGEVKKGYIDISNPSSTTLDVSLEVQAFRQVDDEGSLEFFDSEQLQAGVKLDYESFSLGPREAYRVYFVLDGTKLPEGDVFGAILASTTPDDSAGSQQSVRVGTLLLLQNGTPGLRESEVVSFNSSFLHIGDGLTATFAIRNTADPRSSTGFTPSITVGRAPWGSETVKGPLVFAGRTRTVDYRVPGNYFGPIMLTASVGDNSKGQLVFAVTGYWRWLAPVIVGVIAILIAIAIRLRRR